MCVGFVLTVIFSFLPFQTVCETLTQDVLRLHILANSDTNEDQELKLLVRDEITKECKELFSEAQSLEEAKEITLENLEELNKTAATVIKEQGKDYTVSVQLCEEYFNTRYYGSVTMPAGKMNIPAGIVSTYNPHAINPPHCFLQQYPTTRR